ncbi:DNA repair helicase [Piromyces finnis]|uniref:ATP-dependent DNA helicase CHL1 n=1 Tax=Piromyces finnis TaxID=1754191 RepID=A0A1Y1V333_9FUNG|nr:DNA repair helicase [Piromyces finnis]|eukprot:ORX45561.1 DNA repair helicase [Piromyces finnis]
MKSQDFEEYKKNLEPLDTPPNEEFTKLFPFQPYSIQLNFMSNLYKAIEDKKKVVILESPTGTGKSLSLICSVTKWLNDNEERLLKPPKKTNFSISLAKDDENKDNKKNKIPLWALEHFEKKEIQERNDFFERIKKQKAIQKEKLQKIKENETKRKRIYEQDNNKKKKIKLEDSKEEEETTEESFLLDEYDSDKELNNSVSKIKKELDNFFKIIIIIIIIGIIGIGIGITIFVKVYYSSRTHSQISQFTFELKRSELGKTMKCVSLGSRKNLCVNPKVRNLTSLNRMNDKCLDMNEGKKTKCHYLCNENEEFKDVILSDIYDIEELASLGIRHENCPYYGSRSASKMAQIITLPYNLLIQKSSREALGLDLKDSIIIFDEAHNIIDTITNTYSFMLDSDMIDRTISDINEYLGKYEKRLKGKNIMYIQQIIVILKALKNYYTDFKKEYKNKKSYLSTINEFLIKLNIDHINLLKVKKYLETSRLPQKLLGFTKKYINKIIQEEDDENEGFSRHVSPLMVVENFIFTLSNQDKDGRILVYEENKAVVFKYLLLNPSNSFKSIVDEARTVVLAGGTLEPISDFIEQLFPYLNKEKEIAHYSYDHVIDSSSLLTMVIEKGPLGSPFLFNYENRNNPKMLKELGQLIINVVNVIPDGVVLFFPSYHYLNEVWEFLNNHGYIRQIENKKRIFKEPRNSKLVEKTLTEYSQEINNSNGKGALLLCVVGGKMSEGINFSDKLGRGVIVIGLPFANKESYELKEKMKYLDNQSKIIKNSTTGNEYYENLCMRAVNQSIGRAIRHKNDYACVLLLDKRISQPRIKNKLPKWMSKDIQTPQSYGLFIGKMAKFFKQKKLNN